MHKYSFIGSASQRKHHQPLRTFTEMCEEFGVLPGQLRNAMRNSKISAPEPSIKSTHNTWYNPSKLRAWWAEVSKDFTVPDCSGGRLSLKGKSQSSVTEAA